MSPSTQSQKRPRTGSNNGGEVRRSKRLARHQDHVRDAKPADKLVKKVVRSKTQKPGQDNPGPVSSLVRYVAPKFDPCWRCIVLKQRCDDLLTCHSCQSATGDSRHLACRVGELKAENAFPNMPGLPSREWILPVSDGIFLKIRTEFHADNIEIVDIDVMDASPLAIIAFLKQFRSLNDRWGNWFENPTERTVTQCAAYQAQILDEYRQAGRELSEDSLVIALSLRAFGLSHNVAVVAFALPTYFNAAVPKQLFLEPEKIYDHEDNISIEVSRCPAPVPGEGQLLSSMVQDIVSITQRLILRGRPSDWPSIFCSLSLLKLIQTDSNPGIHYLDKFVGEFKICWDSLCRMFDFVTAGRHPLVDNWDRQSYVALVGEKNPAVNKFDFFHREWLARDGLDIAHGTSFSEKLDFYLNGDL